MTSRELIPGLQRQNRCTTEVLLTAKARHDYN